MSQIQRILSFDIGIKNMALCLFSLDLSNIINPQIPFTIDEWSILNLMDETKEIQEKCTYSLKMNSKKVKKTDRKETKQKKIVTLDSILKLDNSMNYVLDTRENGESQMNICGKSAKFKKSINSSDSIHYFCEKCAKKQTEFLLPKKTYQSTYLKKMKIEDLEKILAEFSIESRDSKKTPTKKSYIDILTPYFQNNCLEPIIETKKIGAGDTDLITIGRNMVRLLDQVPDIYEVDMVLIENQISTIATRMKSVQGMLAQYFIMRCPEAKIEFVSSANKLRQFAMNIPPTGSEIIGLDQSLLQSSIVKDKKGFEKEIVLEKKQEKSTETQQKQHYKKHKTDGVQITREILEKNPWLNEKIQILSASKKKDDLADAFLQGIWYLRKNERIKMDETLNVARVIK